MLLRQRVEIRFGSRDPETEYVTVAGAGQDAVELDAGDDDEPVHRVVARHAPVVRDREHVVSRPCVVAGEIPRSKLSVGPASYGRAAHSAASSRRLSKGRSPRRA